MDEDELDPRIQVELEKLNTATDEINKLEIELDEANTTFRMLLGECTRRLKVHSGKNGSAIVSARPYYEALDVARLAQQECQQAAVSFQRANEVHEAAKETVTLAETRFKSQPEWRFDAAWQEMLNHATLKVREAERQRAECAATHGQATARYKEAQDKVHYLEQRLRRNVAKSRPYFEEKDRCNDQLAAQKEVVESLQKHVAKVKSEYASSLRQLEGISEEIHRKRAACCGVREPGVGAELVYKGELDQCDGAWEKLESDRAAKTASEYSLQDRSTGDTKVAGASLRLEENCSRFDERGGSQSEVKCITDSCDANRLLDTTEKKVGDQIALSRADCKKPGGEYLDGVEVGGLVSGRCCVGEVSIGEMVRERISGSSEGELDVEGYICREGFQKERISNSSNEELRGERYDIPEVFQEDLERELINGSTKEELDMEICNAADGLVTKDELEGEREYVTEGLTMAYELSNVREVLTPLEKDIMVHDSSQGAERSDKCTVVSDGTELKETTALGTCNSAYGNTETINTVIEAENSVSNTCGNNEGDIRVTDDEKTTVALVDRIEQMMLECGNAHTEEKGDARGCDGDQLESLRANNSRPTF